MKDESVEQVAQTNAAQEEEAVYRQGLSRKWALRYGQRSDGLSRLSGIGGACILLAGVAGLAVSVRSAHSAPSQTVGVLIGAMVLGLIVAQALNGYFLKLEKRAFAQVEQELDRTAPPSASLGSPLYLLAKPLAKPRVKAKRAWVEHRMSLFLSRRTARERQAEIFENQSIKLGSIHGSTDGRRKVEKF